MSLIFALLALAALSLAAVALVRSVETGSLIIGNLGFKQEATTAAAAATETAITWLQAKPKLDLRTDQAASGYYAASLDALDVTGQGSTSAARAVVDWAGDACDSYSNYGTCVAPSAEVSLNGGKVKARYVITRLCATEGDPAVVDCAMPLNSAVSSGSNKGVVDYKDAKAAVAVSNQQYYRVVVRATGTRGAVAFTETIVRF
jgi:hypothetical protein